MDETVGQFQENEALERELRRSLQHVPAPDGFTYRVMARIAERDARVKTPVRSSHFGSMGQYGAWWAGIAAALILMIGGGDAVHVHHQRQAREAAAVQAQMDMAMQLTSHALNEVQTGFNHSSAGKFAQLWNGTQP